MEVVYDCASSVPARVLAKVKPRKGCSRPNASYECSIRLFSSYFVEQGAVEQGAMTATCKRVTGVCVGCMAGGLLCIHRLHGTVGAVGCMARIRLEGVSDCSGALPGFTGCVAV